MTQSIGQQIQEHIDATGMTIVDISEYTDIPVERLCDIVLGKLPSLSLDDLARIASAMGKVLCFASMVGENNSVSTHLEFRCPVQ